jgi:hypothetical protein
MGDFHLINKVTLGEMSKYGPGLTTYDGSLALTWIGTDGQFNLLLSTDGVNWGSKRPFPLGSGAQTFGPPALGTGGSGLASPSKILAVRNAGDQSLLLAQVHLNVEGNANSTGEFTVHAPSLSSSYIAWIGTGDPRLNIASCQSGQSDGTYVPPVYIVEKSVSSESSDGGPCLCDFNGQTLIGWRGSGNNTLNVALVSSGKIVNKLPIPQYSDFGPALAGVGSNLYMAWTGSGNPQLNISSSPNGYGSFSGSSAISDASDSGPALVNYNNALFLAWRGSGNDNLNIARVSGPGL